MTDFQLSSTSALDAIENTVAHFGPARLALASSFGAEDQVLTDMVARRNPRLRIFTLDTGRLFEETYEVMQRSMERYGIQYEVFAPDAAELARLIQDGGPNLFYQGIEKRKACCRVRKLQPLRQALASVDAWICGLRREQAVTRQRLELAAWDAEHGIYKICPLFDWTEGDVWKYIREHDVPYNLLHDRGFRSIGCAPCTRAVAPGEDVRAGRWWWEAPEHKECGLHADLLKLARVRD